MDYPTKGWGLGDVVYYFDIRNGTKNSVGRIWFRRSVVCVLDKNNITTEDGAWLLPGQAYRTLEDLKKAVLKQVQDECYWLQSTEDAKKIKASFI